MIEKNRMGGNMLLSNTKYIIDIQIDSTHTINSTDNKPYDYMLQTKNFRKDDHYTVFAIFIKMKSEHYEKSMVLVGEFCSPVSQCAILEDDILIVLMFNRIIWLNLTTMCIEKNVVICDWSICFEIYSFQDGYIIYGETEIIKVNKSGEVEWSFSGRDIFVLANGEEPFSICGDTIIAKDWLGYTYVLDKNGNVTNGSSKK